MLELELELIQPHMTQKPVLRAKLNITFWKDNLVQQLLGCSMKEQDSEFEDINDLLSSDKIQKMIEPFDKRKSYVNFTVKDSYKDDKKHINLVSFEWFRINQTPKGTTHPSSSRAMSHVACCKLQLHY